MAWASHRRLGPSQLCWLLALNLPLCWLTAAGWWAGLPLLLGWQTYRLRMECVSGRKLCLVFYPWELGLPNVHDPAGLNLVPWV